MIYAKDYGSLYSESGRIYMRRHYQQVLISEVCYIAREVTKGLDYLALGSYGTEDGYYKITYGGSTTAAQWNFLAGTTPGALQNSTSATDIAGYWRYTNGDIYEGDWVNDKRHGRGKMIYKTGDIYEGNWVNDKRHGKGEIIYANGLIHNGDWENDESIKIYLSEFKLKSKYLKYKKKYLELKSKI